MDARTIFTHVLNAVSLYHAGHIIYEMLKAAGLF